MAAPTSFPPPGTTSSAVPPAAPAPRRKGRGCLIGCLVTLLVILVLVVGGLLAVRGVLRRVVGQYTETEARVLPRSAQTAEQAQAVRARVDAFATAVKGGRETPDLVLSADDLNGLLRHAPKLAQAAGKVFVTIQGDKIGGEISLPLEEFGAWGKGRHFNGSATFTVQFGHGRLLVFLESAEAKGQALPEKYLSQFRGKNLAEDAMKDPETVKALAAIESVTVSDGKVVVRAKSVP